MQSRGGRAGTVILVCADWVTIAGRNGFSASGTLFGPGSQVVVEDPLKGCTAMYGTCHTFLDEISDALKVSLYMRGICGALPYEWRRQTSMSCRGLSSFSRGHHAAVAFTINAVITRRCSRKHGCNGWEQCLCLCHSGGTGFAILVPWLTCILVCVCVQGTNPGEIPRSEGKATPGFPWAYEKAAWKK
jgi:hypothetical protein